jgi:MinD-like ATPase involved in chromosome partitioning or flagellar assembly
MAQHEPFSQSAAGDELPGDERAADEAPEGGLAEDRLAADEVAEDERAEHEVAAVGLAEPDVAEPDVAEPEMAQHEMAQHEPFSQSEAGDELPGDERAADEAPESGLAEDRLAADEVAEDERAEPGPAEHAAAEAEPAAQAPAEEAPTGGVPQDDRPEVDPSEEERSAEGVAGEDGTDGYRPDEDLSPAAGPPAAPASPWVPPIVVVRAGSSARPTMVERALSGPGQHRAGSNWREHVRVVPGGHGPGRPDMERRDRARVLLPIHGPRLIVVLGCTVGAGQSVTTLMLADVLAALRGEPVAALDLNPGQTSLAGLARTSPAATARGLLTGSAPIVPGQRGRGRLDLIAHDSAPDGGPALADEEYARVLGVLTSRYPLTLTDPGASAVARVLSTANQLVLVAPASADAARAVAMTMEWLDGHGYGALCTEAITVINGVSKRSMTHVEQAELVVRGRCRAIVRVPWDDHLGAPASEQGISDAAADAESRFAQLRPQVQLAYTALAGVLVSALALEGNRTAPPGAAGPSDGAPQRWVAR